MVYQFQKYEPSQLKRGHLRLGGSNPQGGRIDVTNLYLERDGKPWINVMGEFHFSRYPREKWYDELCKMKAGGITTVASYLFWIHHEEIEGEFDFSGNRDIKAFVELVDKAGMDMVLRVGPWAHGECRNGGFPDWLIQKDFALRENNPEYLALVHIWLEKIYEQVKGLFYRDGGNIIAVQLENELTDNAEHLLQLKKMAQEIGYDVPLYTVTGWNSSYGAKIPVDEVMPVFSAYADAPWVEHTEKLPLSEHYVFEKKRNDAAVGADLIKVVDEDGWRLPYEEYPFATCELGPGLEPTHHRRPIVSGMDAYALSLVKLGVGNNLIGYYMYHGGTNPIGKLSTFNESKATGYPNDYPILSYDFQAPLSEYGEVREQYRLLNLLHLFAQDFGENLAPMEAVNSTEKVAPDDESSLRYCMRTDGVSGFVFINHYQRLGYIADIEDVVIDTGSVKFPSISVKGDVGFYLPFGITLGGEKLEYATAQPLCICGDTVFFASVPNVKPVYKFVGQEERAASSGLDSTFTVGGLRVVTLSWDQARFARKLSGTLYVGEQCDLYEKDGQILSVADGEYRYHRWTKERFEAHEAGKPAKMDKLTVTPLAEQPIHSKYEVELHIGGERKVTWSKLHVSGPEGFVQVEYVGDVAQIYADGQLIADDYYFGRPWRIPAALLYEKECFLAVAEQRDDFYREYPERAKDAF